MLVLRNFLVVLVILGESSEQFLLSKTNMTTMFMVEEAGYPIEVHEVTTEDGYILQLHRIPYSPKLDNNRTSNGTVESAPIAIMMHGIIACSMDWVVAGPDAALGYLLADAGFDVWLGNSRGNRYSEKHSKFNTEEGEYWNFSFHEMGLYDLPAIFQYIYNETGIKRFHYFGHSQGTTVLLTLCSTLPEYNEWLIGAYLLAPVAYLHHASTPFAKIAALLLGQPTDLPEILKSFNILPNSELFHLMGQFFCSDSSIFQTLCAQGIESVAGSSNYLNKSLLPLLSDIYPAGSSIKQFRHHFQAYNSHHFRAFDYTNATNMKFYNTTTPPDYNLSNVRTPLYMYYSENDFISAAADILNLISDLPSGVTRAVYKVPVDKWNHIDFLYGLEVKKLLNNRILTDVQKSL